MVGEEGLMDSSNKGRSYRKGDNYQFNVMRSLRPLTLGNSDRSTCFGIDCINTDNTEMVRERTETLEWYRDKR